MREYTSSKALKSANALTIPAAASQRPSHGPATRVPRSGHAPSVHAVQGVSASTGITETRYTTVTSGSARASARGYVADACSISPPIVEALSQPE
jgi:LysM repeat protein